MSTAVAAAERGHQITLFEAGPEVGGQFRLA
ncbi:MAG: NAD(P)-binding protein, partial [Nocardioidaceae bacterium]